MNTSLQVTYLGPAQRIGRGIRRPWKFPALLELSSIPEIRWLQNELYRGSVWDFLGALLFPVVCPVALICIPRKVKLVETVECWGEDSGARLPGFKFISH